jgi:hypothetical protein
VTLPVQLRELADLVEDLEESDVDVEVQDARLDGIAVDSDLFRANLTVLAPIGAETEAVQETIVDEEPEEDAAADDGGEAEGAESSPLDEVVCDVDGCDYSGSERGLAIHKGRAHADEADKSADEENDGEPTLEQRIAALLEEHGELPSTEIELLLETSSDHYRNVLSSMQRAGRVKSRQDPEDRRRNLYRLADQEPADVDGEEQDEADVQDATDAEEAENDETDADDASDDEASDESFPRECHCGATLEDSLELAIHRTEEHDAPQANLAHLEAGEFETIVREADGLQDVIDEVGWSSEKTLRVIGMYDLGDALGRAEEPDVDEAPATIDGGPEADDSEPTTAEDYTEEPVEADTPSLDLADYGTSRDELVDALEGSQAIYHVQRDLRLDRDATTELLDELGLLEKFTGGCRPISPGDAESAVKEVA